MDNSQKDIAAQNVLVSSPGKAGRIIRCKRHKSENRRTVQKGCNAWILDLNEGTPSRLLFQSPLRIGHTKTEPWAESVSKFLLPVAWVRRIQNRESASSVFHSSSKCFWWNSDKVWEQVERSTNVNTAIAAWKLIYSREKELWLGIASLCSCMLSPCVGLAQPSAVQASLYRHHFGNPDISPLGYIFSCTGFTSATPKSARQAFIFINFYLIIA